MRDLDSIPELLVFLNHFRNLYGLEITAQKQKGGGSAVGKTTLKLRSVFAGHDTQEKPALGIFFSYYSRKATELNFIEKIRNQEKTLNGWKRRNLTLLSLAR